MSADGAPRMLVMAPGRSDRGGQDALSVLLGNERAAALQAALIEEVVHWAYEVGSSEGIYVAYAAGEPQEAVARLRALAGPRAAVFAQRGRDLAERLTDAVNELFAGEALPLLIVCPKLWRLRQAHALAALDDLRSGCDLVLGPAVGGGPYLLGVGPRLREITSWSEVVCGGADVMAVALAAHEEGLEVGVLPPERMLRTKADLRAALADPLLPEGIRQALTGTA